MLSVRQSAICVLIACGFWGVATLAIHQLPASITAPVWGTIGFVTSIPIGWLSIRLIRRLAGLEATQIPAACLVVLAVAMSVDGLALRFLPGLYSADDQTCRFAAAWLLWGYGVSAFAALAMSRPHRAVHAVCRTGLSTT